MVAMAMATVPVLAFSALSVLSFASDDLDTLDTLDKVLAGYEEGLNLLQRKNQRQTVRMQEQHEASSNETAMWQGARETGNICMWSNCEQSLGPTECYHFRCVCQMDFVYSERVKQCVHRYTPEGREVVLPQDTGATCYFNDCTAKFTVCSDSKCLCIPGFVYLAGQGTYGGCQRDPNLFPPNQHWSQSDDLHRWQEQQQHQQQQQQTTSAPQSSRASCGQHPKCAGLAGDCCPNELGLSLACCNRINGPKA